VVDFLEGERLTVVFKYGSLRPRLALEHIETILASHNVPHVGFKLDGDPPVSLAQALERLEATHSKHFTLVGQGFEFDLRSLARWKLDFLGLRSVTKPGRTWDEWAGPFSQLPDFVMAWVADCEYEYWQNAKDPLEYNVLGKSYAGFPMISNGLVYPLEQQIIDTSRNPGRRLLREGYIEVIGAVMWLGEPFWPLSWADRKQVVAAEWLRISNPAPSVTRLEAAERCFTTAEDRSAALQAKLRALLFPARSAPPAAPQNAKNSR